MSVCMCFDLVWHVTGNHSPLCIPQSNEYCVYNTNRQVLKYIIQYTTAEDRKARGRAAYLPWKLYEQGSVGMDTAGHIAASADTIKGKAGREGR